jgi:hypothetical protein
MSLARLVLACAVAATGLAGDPANAQQSAQRGPFNRIVVLVDATDSFQKRRLNAIEQTQRLVEKIAAGRPKRWEAADQIVVISLDAIPEVIWKGDARALGEQARGDWVTRFKARGDYARCTDVRAAFELAFSALESAPSPAGRYLIGFSDLVHEPPLGSPSICRAPKLPSIPDTDFAWDRLANVTVAMFWMPPGQKLAWDRAMKENGLDNYRLFTTSESAAAEIELPRPPVPAMTAQERQRLLEGLTDGFGKLISYIAGGVALLVVGAGTYLGALRLRRRRAAVTMPPAETSVRAGRRIAGPVPPMNLPGRR